MLARCAVKKREFVEAIARAQIEVFDQMNTFREKVEQATCDPEDFITMTELEKEWKTLRLSTSKTYSDLVSQALSAMDTKELCASKKANSSRKESD